MVECPTCGDEFDTERGVKIHHTQSHGVSLNQFVEDREWVLNEMTEEKVEDVEEVDIDRMVTHIEHTIQINQQKFDLNTGLSQLES